jgi:hypothetical protein
MSTERQNALETHSVTLSKVSEVGTLLARIYDESRPPAILNEGFGDFLQPLQANSGMLLYVRPRRHSATANLFHYSLPSNYGHCVFELLKASLNKLQTNKQTNNCT